MPAVTTLRPNAVFSDADWRDLTRVSPWRGLWLVAHAWIVITASIAMALWVGHALAWIIAIAIIGGRQLGLAILMHDGAHGGLHPTRSVNNVVGNWLCGAPVGSQLHAYRTYHLRHHRFTQQPEDPDLPLSAAFPTSRLSLVRKIARDLLGISFLRQRGGILIMAVRGLAKPRDGMNPVILRSIGEFLLAQSVLAAVFATLAMALGQPWWTGPLLWWISLATSFQLFLRVRNIAEHACTPTGSADPFTHARTTRAGWVARALVAPYWVNFHAEHHLFMGVPCYHLPDVHRALEQQTFTGRMTIAPGYLAVLNQVSAAV